MARIFGNGNNWLIAGLGAAVLLPALVFVGSVPFVIAAGISAIAFAGLAFALTPRALFEGLNMRVGGASQIAFARDLLKEAMPAAERLESAGHRISDKSVAERVMHLAKTARLVFDKVEADASRASTVKRFLSYYLPQSAEVAEGYALIETQISPDPGKKKQIESVLNKLGEAFEHYADSLVDTELQGLDVDLRLLERSLKEDIRSS